LQVSFRMAAALIWRRTKFLSVYWGATAASRRRWNICLYRAFPVEVATTAPWTSRGLLAVGPDMTEVLAAGALYDSTLMIIRLKLFILNISWDVMFLVKVTRYKGNGSTWVCPFGAVRAAVIFLTLTSLKPSSSRLLACLGEGDGLLPL
jgi:hypothetical protein